MNAKIKDKLSKVKNLVKKYGLGGTVKKMAGYIYSNYLVRISLAERIHVALHAGSIRREINQILDTEQYDRIVVWRSSFGWNVPLYQRPQHIFSNFAKNRTLVFYEVTRFTDDVKRIQKQADNLYLVNYMNTAYSKILAQEIEKRKTPRYLQFYSTDWTMPASRVKDYMSRGYKVVYEYIDDLNPHLAGTDELPVNVKEKYDMAMSDQDIFVVVTAEALKKDVLSKRGDKHLVFSCNGVDYAHFHDQVDREYKLDPEFAEVLEKGQPVIGYYGALAKWFDYELLKRIDAEGRYQVVLFGIKYDDSYDRSGVANCQNIHFLGSRPYDILQNYAARIDVLTIPFVINEITKATSPVKLFEYMALNKPIVTTDMDECRKYESVLIGHDHDEFIRQLDQAYALRNDQSYMSLLDKEALENTWQQKASLILEELARAEKKLDQKKTN